ncbi:sensor histidine kinase [Croceiramulus getboli]|nr:HAMP domain-containing sensor histidine kinase [Flavobacteriaceae bacterium YJPT1-3]
MQFKSGQRFSRWFIIISSLVITLLILWNVSLFFDQLKENERTKMEIYAQALATFPKTMDVEPSSSNPDVKILENALTELQLQILQNNTTIPILNYDHEDDLYLTSNVAGAENLTQEELKAMALDFASQNEPIEIGFDGVTFNTIYYSNSPVISQLKYFPIALLVIVGLFIGVIYFYYATSKASEQNLLWAGMAKETAHQIGTPLSSLVGWTEILKSEKVNSEYIEEITKDIDRLKTITERFSKIGSIPKLEEQDIIQATQEAYAYLSKRSSKLIHFHLDVPESPLPVLMNEQLYGWTIENLVKNAIDAMKGKGDLSLKITRDARYALIEITDSGKGIPKSKFTTIFDPGYTTKTRGWGLGLSLAKRIIEEYHDGQIKVLRSEPGKGTTMQIALRLV